MRPEDDPQNQCDICGGSGWLRFDNYARIPCPEANPSIKGAGHKQKAKEATP